jgi:acyl-ACP thioesterase
MINKPTKKLITIVSLIVSSTLSATSVLADTTTENISKDNSTIARSLNVQFLPENYFQSNSLNSNYEISSEFRYQNLDLSSFSHHNNNFSFITEQSENLNLEFVQLGTDWNNLTFVSPLGTGDR